MTILTDIINGIVSFFQNINWIDVLKFYGLAVVLFIPFEIYIFIWLKKKTQLISSMEEFIKVSLANNAEAEKMMKEKQMKENTSSTERTDIPEENTMTEWERKEREFITCMKMNVGDEYGCSLNELERQSIRNRYWSVANPFVCEVDRISGLLKVKKVGCTDVICGDDETDNRIIYYIEADGLIKDWPGETEYGEVMKAEDIDRIKADKKGRKIIQMDFYKRIIKYRGDGNIIKSVTYQYGKPSDKGAGVVERCVLVMKDTNEAVNLLKKALAERMEESKLRNGIEAWHHISEDGEGIDMVAFLQYDDKGNILFGVGRCWKAGCSLEEIKKNPGMLLKSFGDCLTDYEINTIKADTERKEDDKKNTPSEDATQTKEEKEEPKESPAVKDDSEPSEEKKEDNTEEITETEKETSPEPEDKEEKEEPDDSVESSEKDSTSDDGGYADMTDYSTDGSLEEPEDSSDSGEEEKDEDDGSGVDVNDPLGNTGEDGNVN